MTRSTFFFTAFAFLVFAATFLNALTVTVKTISVTNYPYNSAVAPVPFDIYTKMWLASECTYNGAPGSAAVSSNKITFTEAPAGTDQALNTTTMASDTSLAYAVGVYVQLLQEQSSAEFPNPIHVLTSCQNFICESTCNNKAVTIQATSFIGGTTLQLKANVSLSDGQPIPTRNPCYPEDVEVELEDGSIRTMKQLQVGDRVRVAQGTSANAFSEVFFFGHKVHNELFKFIEIETDSGAQVKLSHSHYIYANDRLTVARAVKVGDYLTLAKDGRTQAVVAVREVYAKGLYNPHTLHGDIVVNGFKASSYTEAIQPRLAHMLLAPLRLLWTWTGITLNTFHKDQPLLAWLAPKGAQSY